MGDIFNYIPGFRSNIKWKKIIASVYYIFGLLMLFSSWSAGLVFLSCPFFIFSIIDLITHKKSTKPLFKVLLPLGMSLVMMVIGFANTPQTPSNNAINTKTETAVQVNKQTDNATKTSDEKTTTNIQNTTTNITKTDNNEITKQNNTSISGTLKVHFINVGQGDSEFIQAPSGKTMLIDAGTNEAGNSVVSYLKNLGISRIDILVGTHPHEDHIGGMDNVINSFDIGQFYMPKVTTTTKTFEDVLTAAKSKGLSITTAKAGIILDLGSDIKAEMLAPNGTKYDDLNNYSAVIKLTYGNTSFLFTGDASSQSEEEMLNKGYNLKANVLKVGHHGSSSATTLPFLQAVNPKYAVISCGKNNDYGHPHKETMDKLKNAGIIVYRTDECGTIVATSDGNNISFNVKPGDYNYGSSGKTSDNTYNSSSISVSVNSGKVYVDANGHGLIKGNINSKGEKIYHLPGDPWYDRTKAEAWFKTEAEAQAAGYRPVK
ncbi:ComEC/Rec2 family competence protein [Thermoanaerobacterium thermosaccharolyticum]